MVRRSWYNLVYYIGISVLLENTTWKIQENLGPVWHIFNILTSEVINDVISYFFMVGCPVSEKMMLIDSCPDNKKKTLR